MEKMSLFFFASLFGFSLSDGLSLQQNDVGCKSLLDFCIVIDGSDSINAPDFQTLRDSLVTFVDQLNIADGEGRMGIIVYSRDIAMEIPLTFNKEFLKQNILRLPHPRDGTNTALGIKTMFKMFQNYKRPNVPKVGIVVTDGISKDPSETAKQARLARDSGVNVFSIGVTKNIDFDELHAIATSEKQVLMVDSFDALARNIGGLVKLVCPADCGPPVHLPHTSVDLGPTIEGSRVVYKCDTDTVMEGNPEVECQENGQWSVTDIYCRPDCGEPEQDDRAVLGPGGTLEGSTRTYKCQHRTVLEGNPHIICQNSGQWSKRSFYCRPDCGEPVRVPRSTNSYVSTLEGNITAYRCETNAFLEGNPTIICQDNGKWSIPEFYCRPDCGMPIDVPRATNEVISTLEGSTVTYQCEHNTVMEGNPVTTCGQDGKWSSNNLYCRPDCGIPPDVPNSSWQPGPSVEGSRITYNCVSNTVLEGNPTVTCGNDGRWSQTKFYCRPDCGLPEDVPNSTWMPGPSLEGSITTYVCNTGTVLEGNPSVVCENNGRWSRPGFYCRPDCGIPDEMQNAKWQPGETLEGSTTSYTCVNQTVLEGNPSITCGDTGTWSYANFYCRPDCGAPIDYPNAAWKPGPTLEGNVTTYVCASKTVLEGNPTVKCQGDGRWSKPEFYCRPDCGIPIDVPNAKWIPGPSLEGSTTVYQCVSRTVLEGDPSVICGKHGNWSPPSFYCRPDCGIPNDIPNASWMPGPSLEGSVTTYKCYNNTVLEGDPSITCGHTGQWSIPHFYCRPDCGSPVDIANAAWMAESTLEGSTAKYKCVQGTVLEGDSTVLCGVNGRWSMPNFYCRPDCGPPQEVPNASWIPGSFLEGSTVRYTCLRNTVLEGDSSIVCGTDGLWSPPTFYCRPDCGNPPSITRTTSAVTSTLEGSIVTFKCQNNTVMEGNPTIKCKADGTWSTTNLYCRPDCGIAMDVPRATRDPGLTVEGSVVRYTCHSNTVLEGDPSITCGNDGMWSRPSFYCRPDCGEPLDVPNANISQGFTLEGTVRRYTCIPGTILEGNPEIQCGSSGQWSSNQFHCKRDCGVPNSIPNTAVSVGATREGSVRTFTCVHGTVMIGNPDIVCGKDGNWSPVSFRCKHDCGRPYSIQNAVISPGSTLEGSVRTFQCTTRTVPEGDPQITCGPNGRWTLTSLRCRPDCGPPPDIPHTTVSHGPTYEGSIATYQCHANTSMEGNPKIMCKKNGRWSVTNMRCLPDCGEPVSVPYAVLLPGPTTEGTSRYYECSSGCETVGNPEIRCMADGKWSRTQFYCHVTSTPVPQLPSTFSPVPGPCDFCKMQYGVGFNPHPDDCDKFTQCYFDKNGRIQAVFRQCPFGQYWDQNVLTCRPSEQVQCKTEKCVLHGLLSYPYGNSTSCRAYWKCNLGKSVGMCCPYGYAYKQYGGCVEDPSCKDSCPPQVYHEGACDTRPSWNNPLGYQQYIQGLGWREMTCAPGTKYDCNTCQCEYHESYLPGKVCKPEVHITFNDDIDDISEHHHKIETHNITITGGGLAYFNGLDSKLVIPHMTMMDHYTDFVVRMRYMDVPDVGLRGLLSNGDMNMPGMMVVKSKRNLHYMAKCDDNRITTFYLPMSPGNWNELMYMHDAKRLEGKVNGIGAEKWAFGYIQQSHSALQIGHVKGFKNFHGYLDYISVYFCRPQY